MAIKHKGWMKAAIVLAALFLGGCSTGEKTAWVYQVKENPGSWNDSDSRQVADELIGDSFATGWTDRYSLSLRKVPVVVIGNIRNLSHERINTNRFVYDLERALVNSGRVNVVASLGIRGEQGEQKSGTDRNGAEAARDEMGREAGADYKLIGSIDSRVDASHSVLVRYYQVELTLLSLADNQIVWSGEKKIRKEIGPDKAH
ncbi:MAG: penicillin-binding protein activator LpoB [Gallionella sp.]